MRLERFSISADSTLDFADETVSPALKAGIELQKLTVGPIDTAAPDSRTKIAFAASIDKSTPVSVQGWVSPFRNEPALDLSASIEGLNLPILSPYAARAVGVNIESGELVANVAAATGPALSGKIDVRINDLFVVPVSPEEAERLKANVGLPVGFAVGILKDSNGVIDLGFPLSGSVADPQIDFSEAINKAISGALASVFPTNWFGKSGNDFSMQPAVFAPGSAEMTDDGKAVADRVGELIASKPEISVRACGRAARADLIALREQNGTQASPPASGQPSTGASAAVPPSPQAAPALRAPDDNEVEALLALANERGDRVRKYLADRFGIDPQRVPQCRTTYSIEDDAQPRAEFQF